MYSGILRSVFLAVLSALVLIKPAKSMEFMIEGDAILATGFLNEGDTQNFFHGLGSEIRSDLDVTYTMYFDSPGGNLLEGVALGEELRERRIATRVLSGSRCLSACAFAFLGGTFQYAQGIAPSRELEWGAQLGFHGFFAGEDQVVAANEVFSASRLLNAILIEYTQSMGAIDYAWVADALTVAPDEMVFVNTPQDFDALSIVILDGPESPPDDWDANLCSLLLREVLPREGVQELAYRLLGYSTLYSVEDIIHLIASPVLEGSGLMPGAVSGDQALELVVGGGFWLDSYRPILDARIRQLDRGAGLYYDYCVTFRGADQAFGAIVDATVGSIYHLETSRGSFDRRENPWVRIFGWDNPLWR